MIDDSSDDESKCSLLNYKAPFGSSSKQMKTEAKQTAALTNVSLLTTSTTSTRPPAPAPAVSRPAVKQIVKKAVKDTDCIDLCSTDGSVAAAAANVREKQEHDHDTISISSSSSDSDNDVIDLVSFRNSHCQKSAPRYAYKSPPRTNFSRQAPKRQFIEGQNVICVDLSSDEESESDYTVTVLSSDDEDDCRAIEKERKNNDVIEIDLSSSSDGSSIGSLEIKNDSVEKCVLGASFNTDDKYIERSVSPATTRDSENIDEVDRGDTVPDTGITKNTPKADIENQKAQKTKPKRSAVQFSRRTTRKRSCVNGKDKEKISFFIQLLKETRRCDKRGLFRLGKTSDGSYNCFRVDYSNVSDDGESWESLEKIINFGEVLTLNDFEYRINNMMALYDGEKENIYLESIFKPAFDDILKRFEIKFHDQFSNSTPRSKRRKLKEVKLLQNADNSQESLSKFDLGKEALLAQASFDEKAHNLELLWTDQEELRLNKNGLPEKIIGVYDTNTGTRFVFKITVADSQIPNAGYGAFLTYCGTYVLTKPGRRKMEQLKQSNEGKLILRNLSSRPALYGGYIVSVKCSSNTVDRELKIGEQGKGLGSFSMFSPNDYILESSKSFNSTEHGLIDLGRYGPFLKRDRRTNVEFQLKNFICSGAPSKYAFDVKRPFRDYEQTIDITSDIDGKPHTIARRDILMYVNETGYDPMLSQNIRIGEVEDDKVHYYFCTHKPLKRGQTVELFVNYGATFERNRERLGYGVKNLVDGLPSDDDASFKSNRNFLLRKELLELVKSLEKKDRKDLHVFLNGLLLKYRHIKVSQHADIEVQRRRIFFLYNLLGKEKTATDGYQTTGCAINRMKSELFEELLFEVKLQLPYLLDEFYYCDISRNLANNLLHKFIDIGFCLFSKSLQHSVDIWSEYIEPAVKDGCEKMEKAFESKRFTSLYISLKNLRHHHKVSKHKHDRVNCVDAITNVSRRGRKSLLRILCKCDESSQVMVPCNLCDQEAETCVAIQCVTQNPSELAESWYRLHQLLVVTHVLCQTALTAMLKECLQKEEMNTVNSGYSLEKLCSIVKVDIEIAKKALQNTTSNLFPKKLKMN